MARQNIPFCAFNRGIVSPKALARVDLDRTKLSAAVMTNWLPKTQGAMQIRPGTKYLGSSRSDTGAEFIEFVAATDDTALVELTHQKMRIWVPSDTGRSNGALAFETPVNDGLDVLLARPKVDTTLTLADTGWSNTSTGGAFSTVSTNVIPSMTAATTSGVTISASSENVFELFGTDVFGNPIVTGNRAAWKAADGDASSFWADTGIGEASSLPSTWQVNFGASNTKNITSYSLRAPSTAAQLDNMPSTWQFQRSSDGSSWTTEDTQGSETGWAVGEKRTYSFNDTGTTAYQYWRFNFTVGGGDTELHVAEIEMFVGATAQQAKVNSGALTLNASSIGALVRSSIEGDKS